MFRRPSKPAAPATPSTPQSTSGAGATGPEPGRVLSDLLAKPTLEGVLEGVLTQAAGLVSGTQVKGFAVVRPGEDRVAAVLGYDRDFVGTLLAGPWSAGRARIVSDGANELFATNPPDLRAKLDVLGMREVKTSLVAPLRDRNRFLGAIVLDRYGLDAFTTAQLDAVSKWAASVTPLIAILESREEARSLARQLTSVFIEAVESLDFDSVGHARRVTELSLKLGRAIGLSEREMDELWYAAMLHDLGKLHGEEGHPLVGANLLHEVSQLQQALLGIRHHHERWDGFGEPDRLAGEEIPLAARIVAVANAYVRKGDGIMNEGGKTLDARLIAALEKAMRES